MMTINPVKYICYILIAFVIGATIGGLYTKTKFLEAGYSESGAQVLGVNNPNPSALAAAPFAPQTPSAAIPTAPAKPTNVDVQVSPDDPVKGSDTAKLTVVEFGDYQCPFCGRFFQEVEPNIAKDYVQTGKVKFVFKNLAFLGKESEDAANAALCAKEQNKFWEYHDKLYSSQAGENQGAFSLDNLKKFAADLGLNTTKFNSCLDSQKYNAQVQADNKEAARLGFQGTPSTVVGTTYVDGAQPYSQFKSVIESELSK